MQDGESNLTTDSLLGKKKGAAGGHFFLLGFIIEIIER